MNPPRDTEPARSDGDQSAATRFPWLERLLAIVILLLGIVLLCRTCSPIV